MEIIQGYIETTYIPSKHQRADIFTEALGSDQFQFSLKKLALLRQKSEGIFGPWISGRDGKNYSERDITAKRMGVPLYYL